MVTQTIVNKDIQMILEHLSDNSKELVKPFAALQVAFFFPVMIIVGYLMALFYVKLTYSPYVDSFGNMVYFSNAMSAEVATSCFGGVFALIMGFALYGPSLAYLSVPEKVRIASFVISSLRNTCIKTVSIMVGINWIIAILGAMVNTIFLCLAPAMILISIFVVQWVINSEITRYGFSVVLNKLKNLARKF
ncbi:hypothetical protein R7652_004108 [Salmonella enterica]|nr:hypothetical protein [Salmonella enterica subsp. enterica]EAZ5910869.1 hypothetical protein [Salmonella enterica]EBW8697244.1 hypothetical protein [Salmonella enterica subsp. diarizonae serovar 16:z10:e,n,x,z15]EAZ6054357.1 hypothetical protein [Salmonella enterica]EBC1466373.1 hypothetical protein [Salmonella enterica]